MANPIIPEDELTRLESARKAADRAYNEALTTLDRAIVQRQGLPDPPRPFDEHVITPLNESWRVVPRDDAFLGTGWKGRLRKLVWSVIEPIVQRQQHFNGLLVDHVNRSVPVGAEAQKTTAVLIDTVGEYMSAVETFQSRLIQYLQQITPYVDTKDYRVAGLSHATTVLGGLCDEVRKRAESAAAREQRFGRHVEELQATVSQAQQDLLTVRRQLERLSASVEATRAAADGGASPKGEAHGEEL